MTFLHLSLIDSLAGKVVEVGSFSLFFFLPTPEKEKMVCAF